MVQYLAAFVYSLAVGNTVCEPVKPFIAFMM